MWAALLATVLLGATAQPDSLPSCNGRPITDIIVNPERPAFAGNLRRWRQAARAVGLHHVTTQADVARAYLLFAKGEACSDQRLAETARILRALPFLANASVRAAPDSGTENGVTVTVEMKDEAPVLVSGAVRHAKPSAFSLGNENVGGLGILAMAGVASNAPYRTSTSLRFADYATFGAPLLTTGEAVRDALGSHIEVNASHRLLSYLQRVAWSGSLRLGDDYPLIVRPEGDDEAVHIREKSGSAAAIVLSTRGSLSLLAGPVVLGNSLSPGHETIVVSDSGPIVQHDSGLLVQFAPFRAVHAGGLLGLRRVSFVAFDGVDALFAPQDVMTGWQVGGVVAPGVGGMDGKDVLLAQTAYVGAATSKVIVFGDAESETRRGAAASGRSSVASVRAAGYWLPNASVRMIVQDNLSVLRSPVLASQLSLGDVANGLRGYAGSTLVGGARNLVHTELRLARPAAVKRADVGVSLFADFARLWAGDAPFGVDAARHSVGFSLIGAYPTHSKRTYRLDFAFPVGPSRGGPHGVQVRFTNGDPTAAGSVEPGDVTQARLAPVPSSLFAWPGR